MCTTIYEIIDIPHTKLSLQVSRENKMQTEWIGSEHP